MKKINIKSKWALICERSSVDANTNLMSIFQIIDEVMIDSPKEALPKLPTEGVVAPFQHELIAVWSREGDLKDDLKVKAKLRFCDSLNSVLREQEVEIFFEKNKPVLRSIVKIGSIKFKAPGNYKYEIELIDSKVEPIKVTVDISVKIK